MNWKDFNVYIYINLQGTKQRQGKRRKVYWLQLHDPAANLFVLFRLQDYFDTMLTYH